MIAIVNVGCTEEKDILDPMGWCYYEVRINKEVICTFKHKRSDGLGRCLLKAANAVERKQWEDFADLTKKDKTTYLPEIIEGYK